MFATGCSAGLFFQRHQTLSPSLNPPPTLSSSTATASPPCGALLLHPIALHLCILMLNLHSGSTCRYGAAYKSGVEAGLKVCAALSVPNANPPPPQDTRQAWTRFPGFPVVSRAAFIAIFNFSSISAFSGFEEKISRSCNVLSRMMLICLFRPFWTQHEENKLTFLASMRRAREAYYASQGGCVSRSLWGPLDCIFATNTPG
jgi:hypothetical protein